MRNPHLKIAFISGPANAASIYSEWSKHKQQVYFGTDYLKQFLQVASDLDAAPKRASALAAPLFDKRDYTGYLKSFAVLRQPLDAFFEGIMVMCEDPVERRRRLSLLYLLQFEMNRVADIARLAS